MIDLTTERLTGLHEAARLYPPFRVGRPTHISTVLRHITRGVRLATGTRIKLEGMRLGGRWVTSVEAVQRFSDRLTAAALGKDTQPEAPSVRMSARRQREM